MRKLIATDAAIRTAEESFNAEFGSYVTSAARPVVAALGTTKVEWDETDPDGFGAIGWAPEGPTFFEYAVTAVAATGAPTGILFGRERIGLRNWEVGLADEIVTFPVNPAYASLNIAQAVLLMSYEWMKSGLSDLRETAFAAPEVVPAPKADLHGLFAQIEEGLDARVAVGQVCPLNPRFAGAGRRLEQELVCG